VKKQLTAATAGIAGAGLMYLLDPAFGKRRRAIARDKAVHFSKVAARTLNITARDVSHRIEGVVAEGSHALKGEAVPDEILVERLRSAIGRAVTHPSSIHVSVTNGRVILSGSVLADQHKALLHRIRKVRGVRLIDDQLETHTEQAAEPKSGQSHWPPATRAFAVAAGVAAAIFGVNRRDAVGAAIAAGGGALAVRGLTNLETTRLMGIRAGRRAVNLEKTINIAAPLERVYSLWTNCENFPFFMSRVLEVRDLGNGRSHWVVRGPGKTTVEWNAVITENVPNRVIAWESEPGALVAHTGTVHFEANGNATRIQIRFSYNPPGGAAGHTIAWLLGADPKTGFDEDLVRMKSFIETGVRPHDAAGRIRD
jgi:uncharacterized membrane protein